MNFSFPFESLWGVTSSSSSSSSWMMARSVGLMDFYCIFVEGFIIITGWAELGRQGRHLPTHVFGNL